MLSATATPKHSFAAKVKMQHRLFAELSAMFGREVPLYDKSLLVNKVCNQAVVALLAKIHSGFSLSDEQLDKTSGERHGAIRIGTAEEYRWVAGFFAAFAMEPHNFYDMTSLGAKSQPIIATAFRSRLNPEHRVFTSLLMIDCFDSDTRQRVQKLLSKRQVFSDRAKELVLKNEEQGGLDHAEAEELVREGTTRIFKWTGKAHDYKLYKELSDAGYKIAADIACFESHHLNHLTPNTFCMDLYTSAMKFCLGELDAVAFQERAFDALQWLRRVGDGDYMKLHFRHLSGENIEAFVRTEVSDAELKAFGEKLTQRLSEPELELRKLNHSGFKDFTEGPDRDTPILLRQDSYKALTEPVTFHEADGSTTETVHTARFGEIEQRFYATTPKGRKLYDECLASADAAREKNPGLAKRDYKAYHQAYASGFAPFPKTLPELLEAKLVFARYVVTPKGAQNAGSISTTDVAGLVNQGYVRYEGLRYEDFLPFSAAGIFASNLGQYGTKTHGEKTSYTQQTLEEIMGRKIVDPTVTYCGLEADSLLQVYSDLNLTEQLVAPDRQLLENAVAEYKAALL